MYLEVTTTIWCPPVFRFIRIALYTRGRFCFADGYLCADRARRVLKCRQSTVKKKKNNIHTQTHRLFSARSNYSSSTLHCYYTARYTSRVHCRSRFDGAVVPYRRRRRRRQQHRPTIRRRPGFNVIAYPLRVGRGGSTSKPTIPPLHLHRVYTLLLSGNQNRHRHLPPRRHLSAIRSNGAVLPFISYIYIYIYIRIHIYIYSRDPEYKIPDRSTPTTRFRRCRFIAASASSN